MFAVVSRMKMETFQESTGWLAVACSVTCSPSGTARARAHPRLQQDRARRSRPATRAETVFGGFRAIARRDFRHVAVTGGRADGHVFTDPFRSRRFARDLSGALIDDQQCETEGARSCVAVAVSVTGAPTGTVVPGDAESETEPTSTDRGAARDYGHIVDIIGSRSRSIGSRFEFQRHLLPGVSGHLRIASQQIETQGIPVGRIVALSDSAHENVGALQNGVS